MNLELNEEQKLIQETARTFTRAELEPIAARIDQTDDQAAFLGNLKKLAELGFTEAHRQGWWHSAWRSPKSRAHAPRLR
jgi:alkylation response protein AidB-like acyl-CoA dehydrogenase